MLYQVSGTKIQVAGTMHSVPAGSPCLPDWLSKAYDECEVFVTEHEVQEVFRGSVSEGDSGVKAMVEPWIWQELVAL